jgi:hypothetical protein
MRSMTMVRFDESLPAARHNRSCSRPRASSRLRVPATARWLTRAVTPSAAGAIVTLLDSILKDVDGPSPKPGNWSAGMQCSRYAAGPRQSSWRSGSCSFIKITGPAGRASAKSASSAGRDLIDDVTDRTTEEAIDAV